MCTDIISSYLKLFKLDHRASKRELELAYEVLTKDKSITNPKMSLYRNAFEYLMVNLYNEEGFCLDKYTKKTKNKNNKSSNNRDSLFEDLINMGNELINEELSSDLDLPPEMEQGFDEIESILGEDLTDMAKLKMATQKINPAMLFHSIHEHIQNICGVWILDDMGKFLKESCLNPLMYKNLYYEMSCSEKYSTNKRTEKNIRNFIKNLKKINNDKLLTPKFDISNTDGGCMGTIITESNNADQLIALLKAKAKIINCSLIVTV